jgi:hypothetical protein
MRDVASLTRDEMVFQLRVGDAHMTFLDSVDAFPLDSINVAPPNVPYTFWHLVEHVRLCQIDMLDYLVNARYEAPRFPDEVWPAPSATASEQQWHDSLASYVADLDRVEDFVRDEGTELWTAAPHAWEQAHTPLRTVMVMVDHAAYHGGEIAILRQVLGLWPPDRTDTFTAQAIETQNAPPGR